MKAGPKRFWKTQVEAGEDPGRSLAETQLMEKLKRFQTDKKVTPAEVKNDQSKPDWEESEEDVLGPAWKRVIKYFYHHIDLGIFKGSIEDRSQYLKEAIDLSLQATVSEEERDTVRPRVERT